MKRYYFIERTLTDYELMCLADRSRRRKILLWAVLALFGVVGLAVLISGR